MPTPFHAYASYPLSVDPVAGHAELRAAPERLVAAATSSALEVVAPLIRSSGLPAQQQPSVTARPTEDDEPGSIELTFSGDEDLTGWPALTGRLLIDTRPGDAHRLVFFSQRSPAGELSTLRLDRQHRRRLVRIAVQRLLHELAGELGGHPTGPVGPATNGADITPMFLHGLRRVGASPTDVLAHLDAEPQALAERATEAVVERAAEVLAAGRFRAPAQPQVHVERPAAGEHGALRIRWTGDEEATGWPVLTLSLVVEPHDAGTRLTLISPREPGYDLSVNRVDKAQRDEVLRRAGENLADALTAELAPSDLTEPAEA